MHELLQQELSLQHLHTVAALSLLLRILAAHGLVVAGAFRNAPKMRRLSRVRVGLGQVDDHGVQVGRHVIVDFGPSLGVVLDELTLGSGEAADASARVAVGKRLDLLIGSLDALVELILIEKGESFHALVG